MGAPGELAPPTPENAINWLIPPLGCTEPTSEELAEMMFIAVGSGESLNTNLNYAVGHRIIPAKPNILIPTGFPPRGVLRMG